MTKTDSYFVNLGHAIIDCLLKLVGGKALRDKIGHATYVIKMRLVMNSIMYYSVQRFKILYSHKPMHYNGTEIDTNIQYQYLHAHDKMMDVTQ
jgi:ribosome biogenesis GTPase A